MGYKDLFIEQVENKLKGFEVLHKTSARIRHPDVGNTCRSRVVNDVAGRVDWKHGYLQISIVNALVFLLPDAHELTGNHACESWTALLPYLHSHNSLCLFPQKTSLPFAVLIAEAWVSCFCLARKQ